MTTLSLRRAALIRPLALFLAVMLPAACTRVEPPVSDQPVPIDAILTKTAPTLDLVLMGTTDVHGRLYNYDYYTGQPTDHGLALIAPLVDSVRAANVGRTYLFDSGDLLQGNPLPLVHRMESADSARRRPRPNPVIRAMNLLDYDAAAVGNHEFNYGIPNLERAVSEAEFPFVTANIFRAGTTEHAFEPFVLVPHPTVAGDTLLIGVTGTTPPGVMIWDRHNVEGQLEVRDVIGSLQPVVAEMRSAGADLVVVLSHSGLRGEGGRASYDTAATGLGAEFVGDQIAREVPGIDVVFLGHTHREIPDTTINGVLLTQAGEWGKVLAVADIRMERRAPGAWVPIAKSGQLLHPDPARSDTAFLDSLRWDHERTVAYVNSVAGRSTSAMPLREARVRDTPILDFINEVQRKVTGADLSAASAFNLTGGIPQGEVTVADIAGVYIYDNTLKAIRINGAQLHAYLEKASEYYHRWPPDATVVNTSIAGYNFDVISGVEYTMDVHNPIGMRITTLTYKGKPVRDDQTFTLALNNYRQAGGGGYSMIEGAEVVYDRQENVRELLIDEVRRAGTIRPEDYFRENWRIVPAAVPDSALAEQLARERPRAESMEGADNPRLRVVMTNDFHGRLLAERPSWAKGRPVGGAAALATYFRLEAEGFAGGPTVLLDGGDVMQGTPVSNLTRGRSTVDYFNRAGYRAAAIGNHEFDWTIPVLSERIEQADFAWLAANIFVAGSDTAPLWARPTSLTTLSDGRKLGVIGLITEETPSVTMPRNVSSLEFRSLSAAIDRHVPALRAAGADYVIVVAHAGAFCRDGACSGEIVDALNEVTQKPDLVVAGHTHAVVNTVVNGVPVVEAGSYGTRYGVIDLEKTADGVKVRVRDIPNVFADEVVPDSAVAALVAHHVEAIGPEINRVVATLAEPMERSGDEYPLGRLIADAQRIAADAQIGIMNNGGIRSRIDAGPATWGEIFQIHPFENLIVRLTLTGAQVKEAMEHTVSRDQPMAHVSNLIVEYDPSRPTGNRVLSLRLGTGEPIDPNATYTVAATNFLADRGDSYTVLGQAQKREDLGILDTDALIRHLQSLPQPVRPPTDQRLRPVTE